MEKILMNSNIKKYINSKELNVASDFYFELNKKCLGVIDEAIARAKANQRKTIFPKDL
jgi:histone H3/H4